tara:strand:+ start:542 stop:1042 length:501 start_codon:yes stop_codon:yes gene_type:complete
MAYHVRFLNITDFYPKPLFDIDKIIRLYSQLSPNSITDLSTVDTQEVINYFIDNIESNRYDYAVAVYKRDMYSDVEIVGIGTVLYENKLIHNLGICAHIEDVVVDAEHRKNRLFTNIIKLLVKECKKKGCYKMILNCNEKLQQTYLDVLRNEDINVKTDCCVMAYL